MAQRQDGHFRFRARTPGWKAILGGAYGGGFLVLACSSVPPDLGAEGGETGIVVADTTTTGGATLADTTDAQESSSIRLDLPAQAEGTGIVDGGDEMPECAADLADTMLQPVFLGFAFDVSGSMGKLDEPWHDPALKWEPVVAATKSFFSDASSDGFQASLTFFPSADDRCESESYDPPDVPMMALPSDAFAVAIDDITPESADDWRGGTPTLAVTRALLAQLEESLETRPGTKHVFVLVSDGYPQSCGDEDDDIQSTVDVVAEASDRITTFVIGVQNPPGGPDAVTNLQAIAEAGGSGEAFIVETGSASETAASFKAAVEAIRSSVGSCSLTIPETPAGAVFEPLKVNVNFNGERLGYDPTCAVPRSWRYDDPDQPISVELCEELCAEVQSAPAQDLEIAFGCETQPSIP